MLPKNSSVISDFFATAIVADLISFFSVTLSATSRVVFALYFIWPFSFVIASISCAFCVYSSAFLTLLLIKVAALVTSFSEQYLFLLSASFTTKCITLSLMSGSFVIIVAICVVPSEVKSSLFSRICPIFSLNFPAQQTVSLFASFSNSS